MIQLAKKRLSGKLVWLKKPLVEADARRASPRLGYMDWPSLLASDGARWRDALKAAKTGPPVLIGVSIGRHKWESNMDTALAVALTLRGAHVRAFLCDAALPACSAWTFQGLPTPEPLRHAPPGSMCDTCFAPAQRMFSNLSIPIHRITKEITADEARQASEIAARTRLQDISALTDGGVAVGEHALAGAIRFFGNADLENEPGAEAVAQRYLEAAFRTTFAARRVMTEQSIRVTCGSHGIYVPQGLVSEVARSRDVRVVNWHRAYRQQCLIFSEGDTYHRTLLEEPVSAWENMRWNDELEQSIRNYLDSRQYGTRDWISFNREPDQDTIRHLEEMGVDFNKPCIGLLTNVSWDAQLHYGETPFSSMIEWINETIAYFAKRPELQLIIRVHPAEIKGQVISRQPAVAAIRKAFPEIPKNVFIIPPESTLSTYDAMAACDSVIIYATKTGIELTSQGIPVIVAGEGWIKNKGFALDASSKDQYFAQLDRLPLGERLKPEETRRALQYAFHFFMRRMIPVPYLDDKLRMNIKSLEELMPGQSPGLDVICDGIINQTPFIYQSELAE